MTLTCDEAKTKIGELVWVHSRSSGRPHTAKLVEILGDEAAKVQPGGHRRIEVVALKNLSTWTKGEHQMAQIRAKHAQANGHKTNGSSDEWISGPELLKLARPDRQMHLSNINWWRKVGYIPEDCVTGEKRHYRYNVSKLRSCGFFDKVKPKHNPVTTPAPVPPPAEPQKLTLVEVKFPPPPMEQAPTPASPPPPPQPVGIDTKTRLRHAIRNRSEAEAMLFEARAEEVRARAAIELADLA